MPAKAKPKRVDLTKLAFSNANDDKDLDWAASHNYDEPEDGPKQLDNKPKSPNANDRHVRITQAASFDNFRSQNQLSAGVPADMPPPYVAFVKHFGRSCTEEVLRNFFAQQKIENMMLVNNDFGLYCLIEFATRDDLSKALMVTGTKMMYQHGCSVDVATPEQVQKMKGPPQRTMGGRSPTSPKPALDFDRNLMGTAEQPAFPEGGADDKGNRGGKGGNSGGLNRGIMGSRQGSNVALADLNRDSLFGSAEVPPPLAQNDDSNDNNNNKKGGGGGGGGSRFGGRGGVGVSDRSADFSSLSRDSVFGSATATTQQQQQSPITGSGNNRPMFRATSQSSIGASSDGEKKSPEAPALSRDMFGSAPPPAVAASGDDDKQKKGGDRFARRSPNTKTEGGAGGGAFPSGAGGAKGGQNRQNDSSVSSPSAAKGSGGFAGWRRDE